LALGSRPAHCTLAVDKRPHRTTLRQLHWLKKATVVEALSKLALAVLPLRHRALFALALFFLE
jgi:hypothetical protein